MPPKRPASAVEAPAIGGDGPTPPRDMLAAVGGSRSPFVPTARVPYRPTMGGANWHEWHGKAQRLSVHPFARKLPAHDPCGVCGKQRVHICAGCEIDLDDPAGAVVRD